jgi:hypothetical protein
MRQGFITLNLGTTVEIRTICDTCAHPVQIFQMEDKFGEPMFTVGPCPVCKQRIRDEVRQEENTARLRRKINGE